MNDKEVVLVMGYPAAGKSTLVNEFVSKGYHRINRDTTGGKLDGQAELAKKAFAAGQTKIVLDNTYITIESRETIIAAAKSLGWHPFTAAAAINSRTYQNRGACMYHGFCNRGGCHVDAKASTLVTTIPRAQKTGRFEVVPLAHVTTIEADGSGRVTEVESRG